MSLNCELTKPLSTTAAWACRYTDAIRHRRIDPMGAGVPEKTPGFGGILTLVNRLPADVPG